MLPLQIVATARLATGSKFELIRRKDDFSIRVDGRTLMSSRTHDSEEALARCGLERVSEPRAVLVGGLGLGFTLRAVLDRAPADATVTVAELVPELVQWNRTHIAGLHGDALSDRRVTAVVGDVFDIVTRSPSTFDVILLDVDNGPVALSQAKNQGLYDDHGLRACRGALSSRGVLAVWSAGPSAGFEHRLGAAGFQTEMIRVPARKGSRQRHVLYFGTRRE
jgi:spermidine synthase